MPDWQAVPFIGLSATPWSKGLGQDYDDLIVAARMPELIKRGFLAPFRVFAPSHPDLSKVRTVAGDYREDDLAAVMNEPGLVANAVSTWITRGEDRPTLLFAVDRAHARRLAEEFEAAGVPTGYVDATTPREEREAIGRRLHLGQIKVVCNVGCLTTGIDLDVRCISLVRPTQCRDAVRPDRRPWTAHRAGQVRLHRARPLGYDHAAAASRPTFTTTCSMTANGVARASANRTARLPDRRSAPPAPG